MTELDSYKKLWQALNLFFIKVPKTKTFMKILEELYTPEEAEMLSLFKIPYLDKQKVSSIAKKFKKPENDVEEIFQNLVKKGVLFKRIEKGKSTYSLLPFVPGIYENYFMSLPDSLEKTKKIANLMEDYFCETFGQECYNSSTYPFNRVLPHEKAVEKTIELKEEVSVELKILPFEVVSEYITKASKIAIGKCACRIHAEILDGKKRCDKPLEVCMIFGDTADYWVEKKIGRYVDKEEANKILRQAEEAGLVHNTYNHAEFEGDLSGLICNCCSCCCIALQSLSRNKNPRGLAQSNFDPVINHELCKVCKKCIEMCPMDAIFHHAPHTDDLTDNYIYIQKQLCIGCGVCASHCPNNVISLKKVRSQIPERTVVDSGFRYMYEHENKEI